MAEKRMFTNRITGSDPFKEMPLSAQALYFHLGMSADDEGFLNNAKSVQRSILASDDDMKLLIAKNFIIPFESGVVAIKHWKMHNTIQPSRLKETQYTEERSLLSVKENKAYTINLQDVDTLSADCQQNANTCCQDTAEIRLDKIRLEENSLVEDNMPDSDEPEPPAPDKKPVKHKYGEYQNVLLTDDELQKLKTEYSDYEDRIERLSSYVASTGKRYKSHYATIRNWARKDAEKPGRKEMVPKWASKEKNNYDFEQLEDALLANGTKTVESDPELKARADALKAKIAEGK